MKWRQRSRKRLNMHIRDTSKQCPTIDITTNSLASDNEIENFRLVCCNCDAQLPTFKSKNRGNGRSYDRNYRRKQVAKKLEDSDAGR